METKTWKKQNKVQKHCRNILEFFKPTKTNYQFETYKPKINNKRLFLAGTLIGLCVVTPATNFMIPSTVKWMLK